ncbi:MAG TPA: hypothetical protein VJV78_33230 [Polyangiales bacterium]|nr:hypothetical protein [Polyangiales bacterium]
MTRLAAKPRVAVAHLSYPELVRDGARASTRALSDLSIAVDDRYAERVAVFLERQRQGHRVQPPASYADFGFAHDAVLAEPRVAE